MRRWVPYPFLAVVLFVMWLLLTQSFSLGQILLAGAVSLAVTRITAQLRPHRSRIGSLRAVFRLAYYVLVDIARSNFAVARIVLFPKSRKGSGFVRLPLELRDPFGLAVLALIITAAPGTVWVEYNRTKSDLLVHILDLIDEEAWVQQIKVRYESLLIEIFHA